MPTANSACKSRSGVLQTLFTGCRPYEEQREMSHNRAFVLGSGLAMIAGMATALAQGPIGTYYVSDAGGGFPRSIWAHENGGTVTRTAMTFDLTLGNTIVTETGPLAVYGNTVATTGHWGYTNRQAQNGEIFTRGPGGTLTTTGQITTNVTTTETFWDGTSDGTYNYMIGYNSSAQGTIYRCNLDWSNATPVAVMGQNIGFTGITYDASDNTFFVSGIYSNGFVGLFHIALPPSVGLAQYISSSVLWETSVPNALAMDVDGTLWMTQLGGTMMHYTKSASFLGSYTPSNPVAVPFGGEIAPPIPAPGAIALGALGGVVAMRRRRR